LHPYTPDTPEAREELGAYLENINLLDMKIGALIADLKAKGLYDKTIIVVIGDNGPPVFRGKGFLYERGIRMPLIVRVPEQFRPGFAPGTVNSELVSAMDMAPTFIDMANGHLLTYFEGRIAWGPNKQPEPEYLFALRDRLDMNVDRCRSVCSKEFKYIRNYLRGISNYQVGHKNVAAGNAGEVLFKQGKLPDFQASFYQNKPEEELYDLRTDPFELNNLAKNSAFEQVVVRFRHVLADWGERTKDDGEFEDPLKLQEMDRIWTEQLIKRNKAPGDSE
jgi:arylsulfatase A-like enzyme